MQDEVQDLVNIYIENRNIKLVGYKTFRGMIGLLKKINKSCKKIGYVTEIRIRLPIKW